jgi:hypothetical protein
MPEHMSVAGAVTIIAIEPVLECTVQLLMVPSCNPKLMFSVLRILKKVFVMKHVLSDNGGRRTGIDRR